MKYMIPFGTDKNEPQVGDYVIVHGTSRNDELNVFLLNNIGKVDEKIRSALRIKYHGLKKIKNFDKNTTWVNIREIKVFAKTKEELELKIAANKYNL